MVEATDSKGGLRHRMLNIFVDEQASASPWFLRFNKFYLIGTQHGQKGQRSYLARFVALPIRMVVSIVREPRSVEH